MRNSLNLISRTMFELFLRARKHSRALSLIALILAALSVFGGYRLKATWAAGTISLTSLGTAYTQNFDTLSNTAGSTTNDLTITGWAMTESGGGARDNEQYAVDTGASTTGDTYSYGSAGSTERALGQLRSGTLIPLFGASFTNNTGSTITSLQVAYTGEEWRLGTAGRTDQMNFEYSTDATDLVTGTWTNVAALNFVTPDTATTGAKNGNAAADRTALSSTISGLNIPNGATFWIRWNDTDATGADDGLAVDDFSLTPLGAVAQPNLTINDVSLNEGNAGTTSYTFTVSLSAPAGAGGVTFDIATADGTATAPSDYTAKSLTSQTIPAGSSTYSFTVLVNGDTTPETNETFFVNVTNVTGANVTDGQGQGTIVNDDAAPNLTVNDVSLNEGNSGTTTFTFTVSLSAPAGAGGVTFDIATANGTAIAPGDYTAKSLTSQTIPAGSSTYTFNVLVNGDTTVEPNETFFVNVTNVTNAILVDGQGQGTIVNDDFTRIHDIQGNGTTSPLVGQSVTTQGVVTGIRSNGYFIQEPDASIDADPNTSEGIFVFTSSAPPAAATVGNLVQVVGTVQEFIPSADPLSPPVTELSGSPTTSLISTGNTLPAAITLTSADTGTGGTNSGSIENLEKYEGMRVRVASLTVVAPTGGTVNEANATSTSNGAFYGVITGVARPFREPGIMANDPVPAGSGVTIPPVPRFDFNPERIRVNSIGLTGSTAINVTTGVTITNLVGPLDYSFRTYTILPDSAPTVSSNATFTAVPTPLSNEFTVASFNMERFFDTVDDAGISDVALTATAFANRLNKASLAIRNVLNFPDILGVEEMENLTTLQAVATKVNNDAVAAGQPNPNYVAYLVEGNDVGGIDVGFLVKTATVVGSTPRVTVNAVVQEGKTTTYTNPNNGAQETLNDRPPLRLMAVVNHPDGRTFPITVIVVHQRSLNGIDDETVDGTGTAGGRVRAKRRAQAEFLANLIQARQTADPTERIIAVGDYNGFEFNDGYVDIIGTVRGVPTPANQVALASSDLVNPDLTDLVSLAASGQNYSYSFDGDAQAIDHELANSALMTYFSHINFGRMNADFPESFRGDSTRPERLSDHDPGVAYFTFPAGCPTITVTPSTVPAGTAGSAYGPVQFSQSGGNGTIAWSVPSNNLPAGLTLNPMTGQLSGTPTVAAGVNVTIRATDANNCFGEVTVTLQINCPTITLTPSNGATTTLTAGTVGQSYSQTFTATPAGGSYSYSIPTAAIPPGLTFSTASGVLSGTPTTPGTYVFTVTATGFGSCTGSQTYSLTINCQTITITPAGPALTAGTAGTSYTQQLTANNGTGTVNFTMPTGSLPTGLTMSLAGLISGTPTATGTFNFSVKATDANSCSVTQNYSIAINCPIITVTAPATNTGTAGTSFSQTFTQSGGVGTTTFTLNGGTLPNGLTLAANGTLSGTPTQTGTFPITVKATDSNSCTGSVSYTLTINCPTITVTAPATNTGTAGTAFSQTFTRSGGVGTVTFSTASALPAGITLSSTGVLSGTPTVTGTFPITVKATDSNGCMGTSATYTLTINCQTITVSAPVIHTGAAGTAFSQTFTQSGGIGAVTFSTASTLPTGITLSTDGTLSGTPTVIGFFGIIVKATDANGCFGTVIYTLTITCPAAIIVTAPTINTGATGVAFSQTFAQSGGVGTVTFSTVSALPTGLTLSSGGVLSGTPTQSGIFTIGVRATDANGCFGTVNYTLTISGAAPPSTARIDDPLVCTGPGNKVSVTATVTNTNATPQASNFTATLTPTLKAVPGSCTANVGTCAVSNSSTVTWSGTLTAGQTVTINYLAQVADGVLPGTQLCATSVATVGGSLPATVTACGTVNCPAAGPGLLPQANSPMSDQKTGSILIFNIYTSSTNANQQNTRISITNTNPSLGSFVHLFFVDGASCSIADSILCLTPNQTASFLASDLDPGSTGYIVAVAIDGNGCPTNFNYLAGDEYVKFASGHAANLGAEAISALAGGLPLCDSNSVTATLAFDGISYNPLPRVLAVDNVGSRADGNDTLLILNRIGGNLATGASTLGTIFGLLYDDSESALSFSVTGSCQLRNSLSSTFPRTTPRFEQFIPAGRSGWLKVFSQGDIGITGAAINFNANAGTSAGAFNQGHNLHKLTLTTAASYSIPVFPPGC